jgi:hypothetical protein
LQTSQFTRTFQSVTQQIFKTRYWRISYPHTISSNQTRYAQIDFVADSVSSDYSSFFDIIVKGNYEDGTVCQKAFTVDYTINDRSSNNSGDCDDLILNDFEFTLNEFQEIEKEIRIKNESKLEYVKFCKCLWW